MILDSRLSLSFLRIALALVVMFSHSSAIGFMNPISGGYAVYCFFVISGYLISKNIASLYLDGNSKFVFPLKYLYYRWARLFPMYFVSIVVALISIWFAYFLIGRDFGPLGYWRTLSFFEGTVLFVNHFLIIGLNIHDWGMLALPQLWSLSVELFFYFLFSVFFIAIYNAKYFYHVFATSIVVIFFFCVDFPPNSLFHNFQYFFLGVFFQIIKYRFFVDDLLPFRYKNFAALFFAFLIIFFVLFLHDFQRVIPFIIAVVMPLLDSSGRVGINMLDDISYGVYLFHLPVLGFVSFLFGREPGKVYTDAMLYLAIIFVLFFSFLVSHFIKKMMLVVRLRRLIKLKNVQ